MAEEIIEQKTINNSKIARNTSYFTIALALQKVFSFIYFIIIARSIGPEKIGDYVSALAYATLFGIFIDIGLSTGLIREIAKKKDQAKTYLQSIISVKLILAIITYLLVLVSIKFLEISGYRPPNLSLMFWAGIIMVLDSFTLTFYAVFRGLQNLLYESIGTIINKIIVFIVGILAVKIFGSVTALLWAILIGSLFNVFYVGILLTIKAKIIPLPAWDKSSFKYLFKLSIPFFIAGIFVAIYGNIDQILLKTLTEEKYAGWYGVAYKLTFALQFIPLAFIGSIYPAYAEYYVTAKEKLKNVFQKAIKYLMIIALPISLGTIILADKIIIGLYSRAFEASITPLQILIAGLLFIFLNFPIGYLLNACNKQTIQSINIGIAVVINLVLNLILIPKYTFIGASIASLSSAVFMFIFGMFWARKIIIYDGWLIFKNFIKIFIAALAMSLVLLIFENTIDTTVNRLNIMINFSLLIIASTLLYFLLLYLFRVIKSADIKYLTQALTKHIRS